mgnify:CR=1 FL=1
MIRNIKEAKVLLVLFITLSMPLNAFSIEPVHQDSIMLQSEEIRKIDGVVLDAETERPIINAKILIEGLNVGTLTDRNGSFILLLTPGKKVQVTSQDFQPISFIINEEMTSADVRLRKTGHPTEGSSVKCYRAELPEYPGGMIACMNFIAENVKYPSKALKKGIQGRVFVEFIIERDGSISDANVLNSIHPLLDAEAVRVIKQMPKWEPGKQDGNPVRVKFTVPINFNINK